MKCLSWKSDQKVTPGGASRVLHRNLLLPCEFLPADTTKEVKPMVKQRRTMQTRQEQGSTEQCIPDCEEGEHEIEYRGLSPEEIDATLRSSGRSGIQEHATDSSQNILEEQEQPADETGDEDMEVTAVDRGNSEEPGHDSFQAPSDTETTESQMEVQNARYLRPVRNRRPPSTLNYASLGNPYVTSVQAPYGNIFPPQTVFYPPPPPFQVWNPWHPHPNNMYGGAHYMTF